MLATDLKYPRPAPERFALSEVRVQAFNGVALPAQIAVVIER